MEMISYLQEHYLASANGLTNKLLALAIGLIAMQLIVFVIKRRHKHKTFIRMQIPGPKPHLIHGHLYETRRQPYVKFAHKMHEKFGKTVGIYLGGDPYLITKDLDLIQQVFVAKSRIFYDRMNFYLNIEPVPDNLICQRGDRWRYMRKLLTPAFSNSKIKSSNIYRDTQQTVCKFIRQLESNSERVALQEQSGEGDLCSSGEKRELGEVATFVEDSYDRMAAVALDVIVKTAFHMDNVISFDGPVQSANNLYEKNKATGKTGANEMRIRPGNRLMEHQLRGEINKQVVDQIEDNNGMNGSKIEVDRQTVKMSGKELGQQDSLLSAVKRACRLAFNPLVELIFCFPFLDAPLTFLCNQIYFGSIIQFLFQRLDYLVRRSSAADCNSCAPGQPSPPAKLDRCQVEAQAGKQQTNGNSNRKRIIDSLIEVLRERKITRSEFTGNAFVIVFAGFETTANALTFTLWLLAKHEQVQRKLRQELRLQLDKLTNSPGNRSKIDERPAKRPSSLRDRVDNNGTSMGEEKCSPSEELTDSELAELATGCDYLEMVLNESLRLYPPVPGLSCRQASVDCQLTNGLSIERGVNVIPSVFSIHRDKGIWGKSANEFKPERFEVLDVNQLNSAMFMPFGLGPRNCIGKAVAMHEMKIVIGRLVLDYFIQFWPGKTPEKLKLCSPINITITNSEKIALKFVKIPT